MKTYRIFWLVNGSERCYGEAEGIDANSVADMIDSGLIKMPQGCNGYELREKISYEIS